MKSYYVYLLTDPRNNDEVFYCGKGSGRRCYDHLQNNSGLGKNNPTVNKIKKIQTEGFQPGIVFLHQNILNEKLAYSLEENYIRKNYTKLTNLKIEAKPPSCKGRPAWNKGKKLTSEHKEKISAGLLGTKRGSYSDAHKKAISKSLSKDKHPMWGKPANNRKFIIELTTNTQFTDQISASKLLNIRQGDIANCLAGRQKSVKGYQFAFKDAK
jgi:hypothetical protein